VPPASRWYRLQILPRWLHQRSRQPVLKERCRLCQGASQVMKHLRAIGTEVWLTFHLKRSYSVGSLHHRSEAIKSFCCNEWSRRTSKTRFMASFLFMSSHLHHCMSQHQGLPSLDFWTTSSCQPPNFHPQTAGLYQIAISPKLYRHHQRSLMQVILGIPAPSLCS